MGWLLELLIEGIRELCSQFIVDMMSLVTDMFTELLSCDLSLLTKIRNLWKEIRSVKGGISTSSWKRNTGITVKTAARTDSSGDLAWKENEDQEEGGRFACQRYLKHGL